MFLLSGSLSGRIPDHSSGIPKEYPNITVEYPSILVEYQWYASGILEHSSWKPVKCLSIVVEYQWYTSGIHTTPSTVFTMFHFSTICMEFVLIHIRINKIIIMLISKILKKELFKYTYFDIIQCAENWHVAKMWYLIEQLSYHTKVLYQCSVLEI